MIFLTIMQLSSKRGDSILQIRARILALPPLISNEAISIMGVLRD